MIHITFLKIYDLLSEISNEEFQVYWLTLGFQISPIQKFIFQIDRLFHRLQQSNLKWLSLYYYYYYFYYYIQLRSSKIVRPVQNTSQILCLRLFTHLTMRGPVVQTHFQVNCLQYNFQIFRIELVEFGFDLYRVAVFFWLLIGLVWLAGLIQMISEWLADEKSEMLSIENSSKIYVCSLCKERIRIYSKVEEAYFVYPYFLRVGLFLYVELAYFVENKPAGCLLLFKVLYFVRF